MADTIKLGILISTDGAVRTIKELLGIRDAAKQVGQTSSEIQDLIRAVTQTSDEAEKMRSSFSEALGVLDGLGKGLNLSPDKVIQVANAFDRLQSAGASTEQTQQELNQQYGLSKQQVEALGASLGKLKGGGLAKLLGEGDSFLGVLLKVTAAVGGVEAAVKTLDRIAPGAIGKLAGKFEEVRGGATAKAEELSSAVKNKASQVRDRVTKRDDGSDNALGQGLKAAGAAIQGGKEIAGSAAQVLSLVSAIRQVGPPTAQARSGIAGLGAAGKGISDLAFRFNNVVGALQTLAAAAKPAYDFLIGSNEKLNAQLLSSQTNLAASTRVFQGGVEIADPTERIKATQPALRAALKQIERDTESLVGVTSEQVNELFQITLTNAGELNNQSKQFPDPIAAATSLTKGWAASLKVVGIPLQQARQEINSIIKGQITEDSLLAKNLNISNQQVEKWKAQGILVDQLNKRLETFVAGNAIASRSIEGIGSNIQDIFERLGRQAGEPLLEPIVAGLEGLYKFLKANEASFLSFFQGFTIGTANAVQAIGGNLEPVLGAIIDIVAEAAPIAETLFTLTVNGLETTTALLGPLLGAIGQVIAKAVEGIAALGELVQLNQINDAADALETLSQSADGYAKSAIETGTALKALNKAQKEGTGLSEAQIAQKKKLQAQAKLDIAGIDDSIKALKELNAVGADNREQRDAQVKSLEQTRDALAKQTDQIRLEKKALTELGDARTQLGKKAASAEAGINRAQTTEEANKAAQELIAVTETQAGKINQISAQAAEERLTRIKNDARLDVDVQQKAAEAILKIYKEKIDRIGNLEDEGKITNSDAIGQLEEIKNNGNLEFEVREKASKQIIALRKEQTEAEIAQIQAAQSQIEAAQAQGRVGEAAAAASLSKLKGEEVQKRIEQTQAEADAANDPEERAKLLAEVTKQQSELTKIEAQERDRRNKERLKDYDEALAQAEAAFAKGLSSEAGYNRQKTTITIAQADEEIRQKQQAMGRLEGADKEGREAINAEIAKAEIKRAQAIQNGLLKEIELTKKAAEKKISAIEDAEIQAQERIQALRNQGKISQEQADADLLQSSLSRIQQEIEAEKTKQKELGAIGGTDEIKQLREQGIEAVDTTTGKSITSSADPKVEETRQQEIRASRKRTAELSKQLQQQQIQAIEQQVARSTALITLSEKERQNEIQRLQAGGLIRSEQIEGQKLASNRDRIQAELRLEVDRLARLEKLPASTNPQQEEVRQQQIRSSKQKTADLTGSLLENEIQLQERQRQLTIQALDDQLAAFNRTADAQIQGLNNANQARQRAADIAGLASAKEIQAAEASTKSLERQSSLLKAKAALQDAQNQAQQTGAGIEIDRLNRAIEIKKALDGQNISEKERAALQRELGTLGAGDSNAAALLTRRQQEENKLAIQRRAALTLSQEQARAELSLDQQRNVLANQRAITEARINELKAKQALLTAQSALQETRISDQKRIQEAQAALKKAQVLAPGAERDRAVADAQTGLGAANNQATQNQANAQTQIQLAQQQQQFAAQATQEAIAQKTAQEQIAQLQNQTLATQQASALAQFNAAEASRQNAQALEYAKTQSEAIAAAAEREAAARQQSANAANQTAPSPRQSQTVQQAQSVPARKDGGQIGAATPFIGAEEGPEIVIHSDGGYSWLPTPGLYEVDRPGHVLTARQTADFLRAGDVGQFSARSFPTMVTTEPSTRAIVEELRSLRALVGSRNPTMPVSVSFDSPGSPDWDEYLRLQRSINRGGF